MPIFIYGWAKTAGRDRAAAVRLRLRDLRAQRHRARRAQGAGQRSRARRAAVRDRRQLRPAGHSQSGRRQLPALLPRPRLPRVGRPHGQLGPRVEIRQRAALLHELPGAIDRSRNPVGRVRAQRRAFVGQHSGDDHELPLQRMVQRRAARRHAEGSVLRALRPHHDDAERPRQRPAHLPDRRRAAQARPSSSSSASARRRPTRAAKRD